MPFHKLVCELCNKRIQPHKPHITCTLCNTDYHPKCNNLSPSDITCLIELNLYNTWSCRTCYVNTFPFAHCLDQALDSPGVNITVGASRQKCHVCLKFGTKLQNCEICDQMTHPRCFWGPIGCKHCMQDTIPGFNVDSFDLFFAKSEHFCKLFNPFDCNSDIFNLGHTDDEQNNFEQDVWEPCSNILENCVYNELSNISRSRDSELKVFSLNVNSINAKIMSIRDEISHFSKFDILCFNETLCSIDKLPFGGKELELESFYPPFVQSPARCTNKGGGLIIYVNKAFCALNDLKVIESLSDNTNFRNGEFLFIEISRKKGKNIIIGNMYRSPDSKLKPDDFIDKLENRLDILKRHSNKLIVLTSDSNIDLLKYDNYVPTNRLVDTLTEHGFFPVISRPTRVTEHSATLIDHIFVNNISAVTKSGIITIDLSDHLAPFVNILIDRNKLDRFEDSQTWRHINDENLDNFKKEITETDWDIIRTIDSANDKYTVFETKYREIYEKHFPHKKKKIKKRKHDKPWILPWLQGACDRKNKLYKTYIKNPTPINHANYKRVKKFVTKQIKKAKREYYSNYFRRYSGDCRKQWQMINELLNRKTKSKIKITKLTDTDSNITNNNEIANKFNNFFCNIAQRLKDENGHYGDHGRPPESTLDYATRSNIAMSTTECTVDEIENIIKSLKNKATSDLAIQPLKFVSREIAPVVRDLVAASLEQGYFPDLLKCAKVIPLHKSGSRTEVTNYRPISLLSCFSKIYEKVMHKRLTQFLGDNKILYESQYGFRALHSCEHALLEAQYCLNLALDKKQIAVLLLIDFSKAFDMVDHNILLNKLDHYGIRGNFLAWFKTYLIGREQYVHVNGTGSEKSVLNYSVPQGSILGPLLFILYINDLPGISSIANFIFFADDANIIITGNTYAEVQDNINNILNDIDKWVNLNGLKLNIKKTKFMVFSNRRDDSSGISIHLRGAAVERVKTERFLGVIIDTGLSWKTHITKLASKISMNAGIIFKLKGIVPAKVLKSLYNSFIQSHLNYCSNVWGHGSQASINVIFTAQKKAVRATDKHFNNCFFNPDTGELPCHTKDLFNRNGILTIHNLITKNCLTAMHKTYLGITPAPISRLFIINSTVNRDARRGPEFFGIPRTRLVTPDIALHLSEVLKYIII